ncbi:outer membrane lipoprotein-sorting protein [Saccharospirillum salsuginis]|uniref:Outer membrane lipoprotein-sorting protein n=1 Tax=Saccharospirillum salsuginis TaxID=418750 RepID=A0A918N9N7_9GAMM|nr:outer membrane lipoprotein-sorting protein [Saccharospirillum salsuginis]GGX54304.1 outer membrane lipoprotein-sorting protein [Saccharospirillum salsuginis]
MRSPIMRSPWPFIMILAIITIGSLRADEAPELAVLDSARTGEGNVRVDTLIEVRENGELVRSSEYDVYVGTDRRSLALVRSGREAGQKILMLDDQFWLFLPSSQRPIRITPMQKMLGEASIGDIASLRWQEDYRVVERVPQADDQLMLTLEAARAGLSYQRVELTVRAGDFAPLSARFFLTSGKLAKTADFHLDESGPELVVTGLSLTDEVMGEEVTRIEYREVASVEIPERWFSPAFLARNRLD